MQAVLSTRNPSVRLSVKRVTWIDNWWNERNFNSQLTSRSLYVVVRPSVCRLSVVCLSVTFVHPTRAIEIFGNIFSERELMFTFAMSSSFRLSSVSRLSVCRLSVTFVNLTQPIEIFGSVSTPFNTLVTWRHPGKILRRSSQGNPSVGG